LDLQPNQLDEFASCARKYPWNTLPESAQKLMHEFTLRDILAKLSQLRRNALSFIEADPRRLCSQYSIKISKLSEACHLEALRRQAKAALDAEPLSRSSQFARLKREDILKLKDACKWIACIRAITLPTGFIKFLLLDGAQDARNVLRDLVPKYISLSKKSDQLLDEILEKNNIKLRADNLGSLKNELNILLSREDELPSYSIITDQRAKLALSGLEPFLSKAYELNILPENYAQVLSAIAENVRAEQMRAGDPILSTASGAVNDSLREIFTKHDKNKLGFDRQLVRSNLLKRKAPTGSAIGPKKNWTELSLLQNEFNKAGKFFSLRTLIDKAGTAIQALTPCMMMSPLSLAKFVSADRMTFDLLVIDEASQMRPEDAVGAMLRVKQIVVVGDQKQLAPTDFFSRAQPVEQDDDETFDNLSDESILELTGKTFKNLRRLKWHYRSKCESLIAFSNERFYDGELITFPTAKRGSFSVDLVRVNGKYKARLNPIEAQVVAEKTVKFMRDHAHLPESGTPTIGVVAINTDQRDLISEEIRQLADGDELVAKYFEKAEAKGEPLFIKNLENVQGDERDFILISMTYGPPPGETIVAQTFGPINGRNGDRRLNVLFSRARERVVLFSSMGSRDIQATNASPKGRQVLKAYLEYAEGQGKVIAKGDGAETDSDFEAEVAERLRKRNYSVDTQVGVSGFRLDLAVRDPDNTDIYLLGIECDGATFHSSKSARDRDRLRQEILESLGWEIIRVWSTDWFESPEAQTDRLVLHIEAAKVRKKPIKNDYEFASPAKEIGKEEHPIFDIEAIRRDNSPLNVQSAFSTLENLRDHWIAKMIPEWNPYESVLRQGVIEFLLQHRIVEPDDWSRKVPKYMRVRTDNRELKYLEVICKIIERVVEAPLVPVDEIVRNGEDGETEFKSTLRMNLHTGKIDPKMEREVLKTIAGFLNTTGGNLVIGVDDNRGLVGFDQDGFPSEDRRDLHLVNLIKDRIGAQHIMSITVRHEDYAGGRVLVVNCRRSREPVYLKDEGVPRFYVRTAVATTELAGPESLQFIFNRFPNLNFKPFGVPQ
jgi:very-short-patch-repair endonuclease